MLNIWYMYNNTSGYQAVMTVVWRISLLILFKSMHNKIDTNYIRSINVCF